MKCLVSDKPLGFLVKYLSFFVEIYYVDISNGDTIVLHNTTQKHIVLLLKYLSLTIDTEMRVTGKICLEVTVIIAIIARFYC